MIEAHNNPLYANSQVDSLEFTKFMLKQIIDLNQKYEQTGQKLEIDLYYDMAKDNKIELLFVGDPLTLPADQAELESNSEYRRVGTIGTPDMESFPLRIVDKQLGVFELDDGEGIKHSPEVYQNLPRRKLKRKFIDSSFGLIADAKAFLIQLATEDKWFATLEDRLKAAVEKQPV